MNRTSIAAAFLAFALQACATPPPAQPPLRELEGKAALAERVDLALEWLLAHQSSDGRWDCDAFASVCQARGAAPCDGPGQSSNDVATTSLAVLAILECESKQHDARFKDAVERGVRWLVSQQRSDGRVGEQDGVFALYNHALATCAMAETYLRAKPFLLRFPAQKAVTFALAARNPGKAWRYTAPPNGENDTSVTGWMVLALDTARRAGLRVDAAAFDGARAWFDEVTDPQTGRCGYTERGSPSSRTARVNDHFPPHSGEALTAIALGARARWGELAADPALVERQLALLGAKPPLWDESGERNDLYAWFFTARALRAAADDATWSAWGRAFSSSAAQAQAASGEVAGSVAPLDPWGYAGGRVYSTALFALCAEEFAERAVEGL
ncbi:MAG: terpene cyclase/mutase family protein [Planctomycetes bacterium]|nr:terpene cyclase/mutase family protein [Planctomycetota bacterium]